MSKNEMRRIFYDSLMDPEFPVWDLSREDADDIATLAIEWAWPLIEKLRERIAELEKALPTSSANVQ